MGAIRGRSFQLKKDGTLFAGVRTKSFSIANTPVDITSDDDGLWRNLLNEMGSKEVTISVSGVHKNDIAINTALAAAPADSYTLEAPNWGVLSGNFFLANYSMTGEYQGAVTFEAELQNQGAVTFTPAA